VAGRRLSLQEHAELAIPALEKVFRLPIPYPPEFDESVRGRLLVEASAFSLFGDQLPALVQAAQMAGDESILVTLVSYWNAPGTATEFTWQFELSDVFWDEDRKWDAAIYRDPEVLEHFGIVAHRTVYSPGGRWGCLLDDTFGILGGSVEFVRKFEEHYKRSQADLVHFLETWRQEAVRRSEDPMRFERSIDETAAWLIAERPEIKASVERWVEAMRQSAREGADDSWVQRLLDHIYGPGAQRLLD
jgi:hypothetical protein